jgi:hypothetical protein
VLWPPQGYLSCVRAWTAGSIGLILKGIPVPVNASDATAEMRNSRVRSLRCRNICPPRVARLAAGMWWDTEVNVSTAPRRHASRASVEVRLDGGICLFQEPHVGAVRANMPAPSAP